MKPIILKSITLENNKCKYFVQFECVNCHKIDTLTLIFDNEEILNKELKYMEKHELCNSCLTTKEQNQSNINLI